MSSDLAVQVSNTSKCYHIYENPRDRLLQSFLRSRRRRYREFWALHNLSFDVGKGEVVGIMGRNGSGKSTLLQLICGTVSPTAGRVVVSGRITALLELGAGFNPEFSGRENVYVNGAIMGLSRAEVDGQMAEIERFADIGEFIEQPVKTYSSGMYLRLAFATAVSVEPDILVVDEALAVGDEAFQRKCFARIGEIRDRGTTIILVTHNTQLILELCSRALLLDGGELLFDGDPKQCVGLYQRLLYTHDFDIERLRAELREGQRPDLLGADGEEGQDVQRSSRHCGLGQDEIRHLTKGQEPFYLPELQSKTKSVQRNSDVDIDDVCIWTKEGERVNVLVMNEQYVYSYTVRFGTAASNVSFGMVFKTVTGLELGWCDARKNNPIAAVHDGEEWRVGWPFICNLMPGVYYSNCGVFVYENNKQIFLNRVSDAMMFRVQDVPKLNYGGYVHFFQEAQISRVR